MGNAWSIFKSGAAGVVSPCSAEFRCSGRDTGSSRSAEDVVASGAAGAVTRSHYSIYSPESYPSRPVKNYRRNPEYKPCLKFQALSNPLTTWPTVALMAQIVLEGLWEAEVPGA